MFGQRAHTQLAPNLSSLVLIAACNGKKMLLTGDARGDKILEGLELVGALKTRGTMHVDMLKMPHHGSDRNMETAFLRRIRADHYVFSGNGEHGNPECSTLEMLLEARGSKAAYTVHLTYPIDEIDVARKKNWENQQQREKTRHETNPNIEVRPNWSDNAHGLKAFLAANKAFARKVKIVPDGGTHLIELGDPLGF
jgi:beta-lactamase superfamily II metal-dependent hydrolase